MYYFSKKSELVANVFTNRIFKYAKIYFKTKKNQDI